MSETSFMLFQHIVSGVETVLCAFCMAAFFCSYMGSGSYEEMEQYIARMDESMYAFEMSVKTGNAVTDVIVNDKQKSAEKIGIWFRSDFVYPASDR